MGGMHFTTMIFQFEETVARVMDNEKKQKFGAERMKKWWVEKDVLNFSNEMLVVRNDSRIQVVQMIISDMNENGL